MIVVLVRDNSDRIVKKSVFVIGFLNGSYLVVVCELFHLYLFNIYLWNNGTCIDW